MKKMVPVLSCCIRCKSNAVGDVSVMPDMGDATKEPTDDDYAKVFEVFASSVYTRSFRSQSSSHRPWRLLAMATMPKQQTSGRRSRGLPSMEGNTCLQD